MNSEVEQLDSKRLKYLKWYLISFLIFFTLILTRHFFRKDGLNDQPIGFAVLAGLLVTLAMQVFWVIKSALLERDIKQKPHLETALNNELVKTLTTESWIAAYLGTSLMTLFFAVVESVYPICDPVAISLTSIIAGAGAHRAYFYIRYKSL